MTDDIYQLALAAIVHHLEAAGTRHQVDDGEVLLGPHRLGLSVAFEDFVSQGSHVIAPVDIQIHLDGDSGDRFRVGTLGVGDSRAQAVAAAVEEWHLLAVCPLLAALGGDLGPRRPTTPPRLAGWDLFAGRAMIRGRIPAALEPGGAFLKTLMKELHKVVSSWSPSSPSQLRSIYILATCSPEECEIQAAIDGYVDEPLREALAALDWPRGTETCLYKQLFVLRGAGE